MNWNRCGRKRSWPELQLNASITYRFYHHSKYEKRTRENERSLGGGFVRDTTLIMGSRKSETCTALKVPTQCPLVLVEKVRSQAK